MNQPSHGLLKDATVNFEQKPITQSISSSKTSLSDPRGLTPGQLLAALLLEIKDGSAFSSPELGPTYTATNV